MDVQADKLTMIDNASSPEELESMLLEVATPDDSGEQPAKEVAAEVPEEEQAPEKSDVEKRLELLEKRLKDKDDFINQRNAEVGLLRKQLREKQRAELDAEDETIDESALLDNPKEAIQRAVERAKKRDALEAEHKAESSNEMYAQNQRIIEQFVPNLSDVTPGIIEVLKSDGAPQEMISQFEQSPHTVFMAPLVIQLAKRAEMATRIADLEKKIAKYEAGTAKIVDNASKFGGAKSQVSNGPATTKTSGKRLNNLTQVDIDKMTLEELQELEKEL